MRFLVLYAHPVPDSFGSAVHRAVLDGLTEAGHQIDDCDLYAENFQPVLTENERRAYHNVGANTATVLPHVERLLRAQGVVFVYPTWWYGMPAMLRGYIDRVWVPASLSSWSMGGPARYCSSFSDTLSLPPTVRRGG